MGAMDAAAHQPPHQAAQALMEETLLRRTRTVSLLEWWRFAYFRSSRFRPLLEYTNVAVSLACVIGYCYDTYNEIPVVIAYLYLIASCTFLVEYLAHFAAATNKLKFCFWSLYVVDAVTIVGDHNMKCFGFINWLHGATNQFSFIRLLRMLQIFRFLKVISQQGFNWFSGSVHKAQAELWKVAFSLFVTLFGTVFLAGCFFYEIEGPDARDDLPSNAPLYLHNAIYWASVTIATIGYGDYAPSTVVGQMLFPLMVLVILIVVPAKVGDLSSVLTTITVYMRRAYRSWRFGEHVVLMGYFHHLSAKTFLDEFTHPDRGWQDMDLVMLQPEPPTPSLRVMLASHRAAKTTRYLQGSPFNKEDLARADITRSVAIFIMCNQHASDLVAEDTKTLMTCLAVVQFLREALDVQYYTYQHESDIEDVPHILAQFHLPESIQRAKRLLESQTLHPPQLGAVGLNATLFPLCTSSLKHALLGAAIHTPGLLSVLANLTTTCDIPGIEKLPDSAGWLHEYWRGADVELYEVNFSAEFAGLLYIDAVHLLFDQHGIILLGLRLNLDELEENQRYAVHLAPFRMPFRIVPGITVGYVLSKNQALAMMSVGLSEASLANRSSRFANVELAAEARMPSFMPDPRAFEEAAGIEDTDQDVDNAMLQQGQHVYPGTTTHHATPPHNQAHPVQQYADDNRPHPADHVHAHAQQQDSSLFHTQQGPARGFKSGPGPVGEGVEPPGSSDATDTSALVQNPLFANRTALTTSTSLPRISPAPSAHISPALPAGYAAPAVSSEGRLPASGEAAVAGGGGADHHPHLRSSLRSLAPSLPHWHSLASSADPSNHPSTVAAPAGRGLTAMHGSTVVRGSVHALPGDHSTMAAAGQVISGVAAHRGRALLAGPSPAAARGMEIKLQGHSKEYTPVREVTAMTWPEGQADVEVIIIAGNSCFEHLDDLIAALRAKGGSSNTSGSASQVQAEGSPGPVTSSAGMQAALAAAAAAGDEAQGAPQRGTQAGGGHATISPDERAAGQARAAWRRATTLRHEALQRAVIILMDEAGPTEAQAQQLAGIGTLTLIKASPLPLANMRRLNLKPGMVVYAVIVPDKGSLSEEAVLGTAPAISDAQALTVASNLSQYCQYVGASLEVVSEVVSVTNASYLLPLCLPGPPYGADPVPAALSSQGVSGDGEVAGGGDTASVLSLPATAVTTAMPDPDLKRASTTATAARVAPAEALMRAAARKGNVRPTWTLGLLDDLRDSMPTIPFLSRKGRYVAHTIITSNPSLAPALASGHFYHAAVMDRLFCQTLFNPLLSQVLCKMMGVWEVQEADLGEEAEGEPGAGGLADALLRLATKGHTITRAGSMASTMDLGAADDVMSHRSTALSTKPVAVSAAQAFLATLRHKFAPHQGGGSVTGSQGGPGSPRTPLSKAGSDASQAFRALADSAERGLSGPSHSPGGGVRRHPFGPRLWRQTQAGGSSSSGHDQVSPTPFASAPGAPPLLSSGQGPGDQQQQSSQGNRPLATISERQRQQRPLATISEQQRMTGQPSLDRQPSTPVSTLAAVTPTSGVAPVIMGMSPSGRQLRHSRTLFHGSSRAIRVGPGASSRAERVMGAAALAQLMLRGAAAEVPGSPSMGSHLSRSNTSTPRVVRAQPGHQSMLSRASGAGPPTFPHSPTMPPAPRSPAAMGARPLAPASSHLSLGSRPASAAGILKQKSAGPAVGVTLASSADANDEVLAQGHSGYDVCAAAQAAVDAVDAEAALQQEEQPRGPQGAQPPDPSAPAGDGAGLGPGQGTAGTAQPKRVKVVRIASGHAHVQLAPGDERISPRVPQTADPQGLKASGGAGGANRGLHGEADTTIKVAAPRVYLLPVSVLSPRKFTSPPSYTNKQAAVVSPLPGGLERDPLEGVLTWQELFTVSLPHHLLLLGLYRRDTDTAFPYPYTSPDGDTLLRDDDQVYVLASANDLPCAQH